MVNPTWDSLDSRPLPSWYDESKFGIFCHWGAYSVPAYRSEWFWWYWKGSNPDPDVVRWMNKNYKPDYSYADFAKDFTAEMFNPKQFADIVQASGARYFVLTSKHHEGFTMWPSRTSWNWNAVDIGPKRDIVGQLKEAFKSTNVHYGLYFSQFEWFNPMFLDDGKYNTTVYTDQVSFPQMIEIVNKYKPEVIWSDGEWDRTDDYWKSKDFLAWLYNTSPVKDTVVVNDRWGAGTAGKHGGFMTFQDHYTPGKLVTRKWENCLTLDRQSWGNRRNMTSSEVLSVFEILREIATTVSCNGNVLLNVGPDMHGLIPTIFEDRLRELGLFLYTHSEALYGTKPWTYQIDTVGDTWYTSRYRNQPNDDFYNKQIEGETIIYAWILKTSVDTIVLNRVTATVQTKITVMSTNKVITPTAGKTISIASSDIPWKDLQRRDAVILKIEYAASDNVGFK
ncbi:hypothetical protein WR25_26538 isoform B [Diploscapter pachys]|uniref:Putative alpha-L-fucosidase n=1 Tax=Diploscapter pachys TaxID=2018661 RepID=A0A2A2LIU7_9BILA|nr:hypothetical protein WR25_26538 isoform B [Diploscapter pachys]